VKEVTSSFTAKDEESRIRQFWKTEDIYARVKDQKKDEKTFFFVDGPPYTTGHIHLGTAWNKIIKDCVLRYYRMQGCNVIDRAGYDMHGLPIEVRVEHELGFSSKKDIEEYGIADFIEKCKQFALDHMDIMNEQFRELGVWMDFDDPYQTVKEEYIEAAWWVLKQADEKGMLERGFRSVNWCPRCETAIADSEVEYWDEEDYSIYVKFPIIGQENEFLVIWTTTPWTLPANVAVAVNPGFIYARVRAVKGDSEEILWIAEELVESVLRKGRYQDYAVLETHPGSDLIGVAYQSPLSLKVPIQAETEHRVVAADFVELENTGMVHIAPGHGWDDFLLGSAEGLPILCPVDSSGRFTEEAGVFAGMHVKDANPRVLEELADFLMADDRLVHRYGHCWRCKTPIIYRATEQWFLSIPSIKEKMLSEIENEVTWYPEWAGSARFYDFVAGAREWCISRQRYWGIPIPVWECDTCNTYRVFGMIAELEEVSGSAVPDPHRPYVDAITFPCGCGGTMRRVKDIFDVWFDSANASWATVGFPRKTAVFDALWPADFITEGQDQTRGWFYSQLGASTIAFGRSPYKSVLMHGFALDADGRKMSKSFGNVVTPREVIEQFGVDVLRLYMLSANAPWDDLKFNWEGVRTVHRTMNILWNVYRFPLPYMILDDYVPPQTADGRWDETALAVQAGSMPPEDRWIISRVESVARTVSSAMKEYQLHRATRTLTSFVLEDISRWYIQLIRQRMWLEEDSPDKRHAYDTMYYVMRMLARLLAPFTPYVTEAIYRNLRLEGDPESVHMLPWFSGDADLIDETLEAEMEIIRSFDDAVANARQAGKRKLRWPVAQTVVITDSDAVASAITRHSAICASRANSRIVEVISGRWDRIGWRAEPVMRAIGPQFGKEGPKVKALIENADGGELKAAIEATGSATVGAGDQTYTISAEQVTFSEQLPESVHAAPMNSATVYVDVELSDDLEAEGFAREVIRRLQEMRRLLELNVEDSITGFVRIDSARISKLLSIRWKDAIMHEVRATSLLLTDSAIPVEEVWDLEKIWDVEGIEMQMGISLGRQK
jgi:isoleucyl-tRNA synthetase